jgi:hypothetical protein
MYLVEQTVVTVLLRGVWVVDQMQGVIFETLSLKRVLACTQSLMRLVEDAEYLRAIDVLIGLLNRFNPPKSHFLVEADCGNDQRSVGGICSDGVWEYFCAVNVGRVH